MDTLAAFPPTPSSSGDVEVYVPPVVYPESDGQPMADNTKQFEWICTLNYGFADLYRDDPRVFVAGDLLWYPVEGENKIRLAPDVLIAFGRPKGHRGSYLQWLENGIAPQVVFEVLSPGNRPLEMEKKRRFYATYGVQEYYEYDPDFGDFAGWLNKEGQFEPIEKIHGWVSPKTGVRFELHDGILSVIKPDGQPFLTYLESRERDRAMAKRADEEKARADEEQARAEAAEAEVKALKELLRSMGKDV